MAKKMTDKILPTTMVGSYPRPAWFTQQLLGRDIRVAFKEVRHEEAFEDAIAAVVRDQKEAGLDFVTDGNMWYDDYVGAIGAFCWYLYERIEGFDPAREPHPTAVGVEDRNKGVELLDDWGGVINNGPVGNSRLRFADIYKYTKEHSDLPVKVSIGAGPANLAWHAYFNHYKDARELSLALAPIFNKEMKECVAAGAEYLQIEDLGPWLPLFTGNDDDFKWVKESIEMCCDGVDAKIGWHFCFGNAWGNDIVSEAFPQGYQTVLPHLWDTKGIDEFVLDYANRDMDGVDFLKNLPEDKSVAVGVIDIRANTIESPQKVAERTREVLKYVPADRVTLSTDCGMKPLPRTVAKMKLKALADGAAIVRKEIS